MNKYALLLLLGPILVGGCHATAKGVATDTKANTNAVKGAVETLDVKAAIIADKTIDSGAIDVDTFADKKTVVLRGSVPTQAQKLRAEQIARDHATGYLITNQLAVVPTDKPTEKPTTPEKPTPPPAK
jgi:osmotically-inducible protein OsmY